jgi:hypothetical protein
MKLALMRAYAIPLWLLGLALTARPQTTVSAVVSGTVFDPSGAVIPHASVHLIGVDGERSATTDRIGHFELSTSPGIYELRIEATGFQPHLQSHLRISAEHMFALNITLKIAIAKEELDVSSESGLSTDAADNKSALVFKGEQLDTFSEDPSVMQLQLQALGGANPGDPPLLYVDGFSNGAMPPKDSIREIRINQNPFTAQSSEFGRGRIDVFTKPGSTQLHGSLEFNYGNSTLNARNPYTGPQPPYSNDYSVASLNGPLGKKTSFFVTAERSDLSENAAVNAVTVDPTTLSLATVSEPVPNEVTSQTYSARIDRQLGAKDTFIGRYTFSTTSQPDAGVGLLVLPSQGYSSTLRAQTLQLTDTHLLGPKLALDSGLQYIRTRQRQDPLSTAPALIVQGSFSSGGNPEQQLHDDLDRLELQEYATLDEGKHLIRTGMRYRLLRDANLATAGTNSEFVFSNITDYQNTLMDLQNGLTGSQILAKGDGASQFSLTTGMPNVSLITSDVGLYAEDEWKAKSDLSFTYGLRLESQSAIPDHLDIGPRVGFAYALKFKKTDKEPVLVFRGGFGVFYKRFASSDLLTSLRENGVREQVYFCTNPDFFPSVTPDAACLDTATAPTVYRVSPGLHTPVQMQGMFGVEHSFGKFGSLAASYFPRRQFHELDSLNLNAPLPGSGLRPFGGTQNVYQFSSDGISKGQDMNINGNLNLAKWLSAWATLSIDHDESDTSGSESFPSNSYNPGADMGAYNGFASRKLFLGMNAHPGWDTVINLFFGARSHSYFNITTGQDNNDDSIYNDRPAFATDLSRPSVVRTSYGNFDTEPLPDQTIIPINYGHAPAFTYTELYASKDIHFGPRPAAPANTGPAGKAQLPPPRYRLQLGIEADNVLNLVNPGPPVGILTSPFFGKSISLNAPFTNNTAANRAVTLRAAFFF